MPRRQLVAAIVVAGLGVAGVGAAAIAAPAPAPTGPAAPAAERSTALPGTAVATDATCGMASRLSLRAALAQTLMIGLTDPTPGQLRAVLAGPSPGGVFVHGNDAAVITDGRLRRLANLAIPPLVAVDDEGGRVQHLRAIAGDMPSARQQRRTMSPAQVRALAQNRGELLRRAGVTMNMAPVVDTDGGAADHVIGDRSYGRGPRVVSTYAGAFARGLRAAGVLPTLKHFPGHGRADGDSHRGPASTPPVAQLRKHDWMPYRVLAEPQTAVMMGHLRVPGLSTPGLPASLDPAVYRALRTEIGFRGLVVTDELAAMRAVRDRWGLAAALRRSLAAGADLALFFTSPQRFAPLLGALARDVERGLLPERRVRVAAERVLAAKGCPGPPGSRTPAGR